MTSDRTRPCSRADASVRLRQAETLIEVADLVTSDDSDVANPGVAAALAVLAGIAAADAACCARLARRARGQSHIEALVLVRSISPGGPEMAKDLQRLLGRKDDGHYGMAFVSASEADRMVAWAKRLLNLAKRAVEA